jgi:hypothetical protein
MKKISVIILWSSLAACGSDQLPEQQAMSQVKKDTATEKVPPVDTIAMPPKIDTTLFPVSRQILVVVKQKDFPALAKFVHPERGLWFSPYANVDTLSARRFSVKELRTAGKTKKFLWGSYAGNGEDIRLSLPAYFDRFVYDAEFLEKAQIAQNNFLSEGNKINNAEEIFPQCEFVDFYIKGVDPKMENMDWRILRLVFKTEKGTPYLVAIIHDQWTI